MNGLAVREGGKESCKIKAFSLMRRIFFLCIKEGRVSEGAGGGRVGGEMGVGCRKKVVAADLRRSGICIVTRLAMIPDYRDTGWKGGFVKAKKLFRRGRGRRYNNRP